MFARALWTLRQPRYQALAALMVVVAVLCVLAGTWQISRFNQSVRENDELKANAHAAATALSPALVALTGSGAGSGPAPARDAVRFRTVRATGTYDSSRQQYLTDQTSGSAQGTDVIVPLRTADGVLLVVRGLVRTNAPSGVPRSLPTLPSGPVTITGRIELASGDDDFASTLPNHVVLSINPAQQAQRLGVPVYQAFVMLNAKQPGSVGTVTAPDLSNPAGGAYEGQHFAYIIQWYLFALLALAAPFIISRHEIREARKTYLGIDPGEQEFGVEPERLSAPAGSGSAQLVARGSGGLALRDGRTPEQWARAARIADRYGRSLGPADDLPRPRRSSRRTGGTASRPSRAEADGADLHAEYNDHLWRIALADGQIPDEDVDAARRVRDDEPGSARDAGDPDTRS